MNSSLANGNYPIGQVVPIAIAFSENVNVTGTPRLALNNGGIANYVSGSGTNTLLFNHTVAAGQNTVDLDYASAIALSLNAGTIKDVAGNNSLLNLPAPGAANSLGANKAIAIDATAPTISGAIATIPDGNYTVGRVVPIAIAFSENVNVTGTPTLALNNGGIASYAYGSGSNTLTFNYTVAAGQNTPDLDYANANALSLNGGAIKDATGNSATLTLPAPGTANSISANKAIAIDTIAPTIANVLSSAADDTYLPGQVIPITILFSENVSVSGTPKLALNSGGTADYVSGSGTNALVFYYTVASNQQAFDLDSANANALSLNGGAIKDGSNNNANLTLPAPGAAYSLGANKNIAVFDINPSIDELADGIETSLNKLQESLNTYIPSDTPIVGDKLKTALPGFLNTIKDNLTVRLRQGKGIQDSQLEGIFKTSLGGDFPDLQVQANVGLEESTFQINLTKDYTKDMPFAADFGLPALGLQADGTARAGFKYDLSLGFGINKQNGFFLDSQNTYLNLDAGVDLGDTFSARGNLGFLQLDVENNPSSPTQVGANFQVKLNDIDNIPGAPDDGDRLTLKELKGQYQASNLYKTSFETNANLGLKAVTSFEGNAAIPSFLFDLNAAFPLVKYENGQLSGPKQPNLEFKNMQLDLGTFISDFAKPIITTVNDIIAPVRPLVNVLNSDIKPLSQIGPIRDYFDQNKDKKVTLIEAGATLAGKKIDTRFLDAIEAVDKASQLLRELAVQDGTIKIDLGDYQVDFDATNPNADSQNAQKTNTKSPGASPTEQAKSKTNGKVAEFLSTLQNMPGLSFPILSDPGTAVDLLLGKPDVTLFAYKVPKLEFGFDISKEFPIYSIPVVNVGVNGVLKGSFSAQANLGFGFDTYGLSQWKASGFNLADSYKVLDGLYVSDRENADATGPDVSELKLKASLGVGANLSLGVARAGVIGGIEGIAKLDLLDVGEENGTSDGKIRASEIISRITNPLSLFEINGEVNAFLDANAEYYVPFSWNTAWAERLATMKLADFRLGTGSTRKSRAIDGYLSGSTVFLDANFNNIFDEDEPFTITNPDGSFDLTAELEKFDTNKNGQIDYTEGKIVLNNGMDVATYLPLDTPLASTPESTVVTPLTTIIAELVAAGTEPEAAENGVKSALSLPDGVDLASYDPLEAIANGDGNGVAVFAAMIQVQNTIVQTAKFIDGVSETPLIQLGNSAIAAIAGALKAGTPVDLSQLETIQAIVSGAIAAAAKQESNLNTQQLATVASTAAQVMALGNQLVNELAASGLPLKDIATEITKLQAVSVGQIAVGLPELAAGTLTVEQFLADNTKEAVQEKMAQVKVNDPTVRPTFETIDPEDLLVSDEPSADDGSTNPTDPGTPAFPIPTADSSASSSESDGTDAGDCNCPPTPPLPSVNFDVAITIAGTDADDSLVGTPEAEGISGGAGNDTAMGMEGNDTILGGNGSTSESNSSDADELFGNAGSDLIAGNSGSDTIYGGKGSDLAFGGKDNDLLHGDMGDDTLSGDMGSDTVCGDSERDLIYGQAGDDLLYGNAGSDSLSGGTDEDTIYGGKDDDLLHGDAGNDLLVGDAGNDSLCAGDGDDTVVGGLGHSVGVGANGEQDTLCGGAGNDLMTGNEGEDSIDGGTGNDTLFGGKDNDVVKGDAGADIVSGNFGSDNLSGGAENDALYGNQDDDTLDGGTGNDSLNGGQQNDILTGGDGDDWLAGDLGNDSLTGGAGSDKFVLTPTGGSDTVTDFEDGVDSLVLAGGLTFEQLSIAAVEGGTAISLASTGELLATLNGVQSNLIGVEDFTLLQNGMAVA